MSVSSSLLKRHPQLSVRIDQVKALANRSSCRLKKSAAIAFDVTKDIVVTEGYAAIPLATDPVSHPYLCTPSCCVRDGVYSTHGEYAEIGCNEALCNLVCNAAANGTSIQGTWVVCTHLPSLMEAKLIHHAGVKCVLVLVEFSGFRPSVIYLNSHNIDVHYVSPED